MKNNKLKLVLLAVSFVLLTAPSGYAGGPKKGGMVSKSNQCHDGKDNERGGQIGRVDCRDQVCHRDPGCKVIQHIVSEELRRVVDEQGREVLENNPRLLKAAADLFDCSAVGFGDTPQYQSDSGSDSDDDEIDRTLDCLLGNDDDDDGTNGSGSTTCSSDNTCWPDVCVSGRCEQANDGSCTTEMCYGGTRCKAGTCELYGAQKGDCAKNAQRCFSDCSYGGAITSCKASASKLYNNVREQNNDPFVISIVEGTYEAAYWDCLTELPSVASATRCVARCPSRAEIEQCESQFE